MYVPKTRIWDANGAITAVPVVSSVTTRSPTVSVTGSLNVTATLMASVSPYVPFGVDDATLITVGAVLSYVTWLSVEVEAALVLPAASVGPPAGMATVTIPSAVIPVTVTV